MTRTLTRSYQDHDTASNVVDRLEKAGIGSGDISLVSNRGDDEESAAPEGAGIGGTLGGAAGLLTGLGIMAIPGIGPVVAAGWLAATAAGAVAGAAAGGIVGSFISAGVSEDDANYYAESIRRGGSVVSVQASEEHVTLVQSILDGADPLDDSTRRAEFQKEGWTRFDETSGPYRPPVV